MPQLDATTQIARLQEFLTEQEAAELTAPVDTALIRSELLALVVIGVVVAGSALRPDSRHHAGIDVLPSAANFVFAPMPGAVRIARRMRERGVAVRAFSGLPRFCAPLGASGGDALRITVGPAEEMAAALEALDTARAECA